MQKPKTANFQAIALIATMRSGSNLLERTLSQNPQIVGVGELFNNHFIGRVSCEEYDGISLENRQTHPESLLSLIGEKFSPKIPIFRYFHDHQPNALEPILNDPHIAKILLKRDPLESYVSLKIAQKTDNWLMGRRYKDRKDIKINFKPESYERWVSQTQRFYETIETRLDETDQDFIKIRYENIKNLDSLEEIREFLGLEQPYDYFFEPTNRQNPQPIESYLENPEALGEIEREKKPAPLHEHRQMQPVIDALYYSPKLKLAYLPIQGNGIESELKALAAANGEKLEKVSAKSLAKASQNDPDIKVFTRVIEPSWRLYTIFMEHVFQDVNGFDISALELLNDRLGLNASEAPENNSRAALNKAALPPRKIRRGYKEFAVLLRKELWGGLRNNLISDQYWPQSLIIENMRHFFTIHVLKGAGYPNDDPFLPLMPYAPIQDDYISEPLDARSLINKHAEQQVVDLYREDYEVFGFSKETETPED